jgi:hypothetical protein
MVVGVAIGLLCAILLYCVWRRKAKVGKRLRCNCTFDVVDFDTPHAAETSTAAGDEEQGKDSKVSQTKVFSTGRKKNKVHAVEPEAEQETRVSQEY